MDLGDLLDEGLLRLLGRILLAVFRAVFWLVWELGFEDLGWFIGWPCCRALSLGRWPVEAWNEQELAPFWVAILVSLVGISALGLLVFLLSQLLA